MKIRHLALPMVATLALGLSGCGNGDNEKASSAVASGMLKNQENSSFKITKKQASCVGDGMVDKLGVDKLKKYGIVTKDLKPTKKSGLRSDMNKADAKQAAGVVTGCMDFKKLMLTEIEKSVTDPKAKQCLDKSLTESKVKDFLTATFAGDDQSSQESLSKDMINCMKAA